jgi:membrane associated rhomboid family serine protease
MSYNDHYRPGGFSFMPLVTKNIIIINVIVFALTFLLQSQGINFFQHFGLHHHSAPHFRVHQFVTYLFMHGNMQHIFFNMFGVFIFGQVLENLWGPKRFLIFYILTGLGAALTQYIIMHFQLTEAILQFNEAFAEAPTAMEKSFIIEQKYDYLNANVIVGASGSLFGLLGAFGMLFPNRYLYLYFLFPVKAKWLVIAYGLIELFSGFNQNPNDNVAHFAHIGGLVVGLVLVLVWRKDRRNFY